MGITYKIGFQPETQAIINLYNSSGINRPTSDSGRIANMYAHSNLVVTAWQGEDLVGIARSLTDYCYACYLSDLAVHNRVQHKGIGKKLISLTQEQIGPQTMLLLLSAPSAMDYYEKVGFEKVENGFIIKRTQ